MSKDIKVLGIDLAKNVFQIHGTDKHGKKCFSKRVSREKLVRTLDNLKPCLIGIEACTGSNYWARTFARLGHEVKIMAPQFVKPYVMSNKNDANDAKGIAEAVTRPEMRFVPRKTVEQQDVLLLHRARQLSVKGRTAQSNQIRGLLAEYGIVIAQGISTMRRLPSLLEAHQDKLTHQSTNVFIRLHEFFKEFDKQVKQYDKDIENHVANSVQCQALLEIDGIGSLSASAIVATVGSGHDFKNGREMAAWLGLVPRQNSSGNKIRLGGISKRGDRYLRTLLIHGARCALKYVEGKSDRKSQWALKKKSKCSFNKAAVALANKHARIIWAMLKTGESYRTEETTLAE
jgi:transposase